MTRNIRRGLTRMQSLARASLREDKSIDKWSRREIQQAILWIERQITGQRYARTGPMSETELRAARRAIRKLIGGGV